MGTVLAQSRMPDLNPSERPVRLSRDFSLTKMMISKLRCGHRPNQSHITPLELIDSHRNNPEMNVPGLEMINNHTLEVSVKAQSTIDIPIVGTWTINPTIR
jgi:hypothetical protein